MSPEQSYSADVWRGIAIFAILLLHAYATLPGITGAEWYHPYFHNLGIGVQLFFVLSGYLISHSWDRCTDLWEFYVRRAAKIVPLYMIFLVLSVSTFLVVAQFADSAGFFRNGVTWENLNWWNVVIHLTFLQGWSPQYMHSLVDGSWSIVNEVYFYALYPLIRTLVRGIRQAVLFWVAALALQSWLADPVFAYASERGNPGFVVYYFFASLPAFALGMAIYWLRREGLSRIDGWSCVIALSGIYYATYGVESGMLLPHNILLVMALPLIVMTNWRPGIVTDVLSRLGRQSYALYFVHLYAVIWFTNLVAPTLGQNRPLIFALNLVICFPLSIYLSDRIFNRIDAVLLSRILAAYRSRRADKGFFQKAKRADEDRR